MRYLIQFLFFLFISLHTIASTSPRIIGYYPFWVNMPLTQIPFERITQLSYAFASVDAAGKITPGEPAFDLNKPTLMPDGTLLLGNYAVLQAMKRLHPELKTVIAIGGWHNSAQFSNIAADPSLRREFAQSVQDFTARYGFDGIELAWHYPGFGGKPGNSQRPDDGDNLVLLLQAIRSNATRPISIGLSLGPLPQQIQALPLTQLMPLIDYAVLQVGDYSGAWSPSTGHKSPLYAAQHQQSIAQAVQALQQSGADPSKLVMLVPTQGMSFLGVAAEQNGLGQAHHGASFGTWDDPKTGATGMIGQNEMAVILSTGDFTPHWDQQAQASTFYSQRLQQFISIETPQSLNAKLAFSEQHRLAGMALWDLSSDASSASLLQQIEQHYYPLRALKNDLRQRWQHHPAWIEALLGVLLATLIFIAAGVALKRRRDRDLDAAQIAQLKQIRSLHEALPHSLLALEHSSQAILTGAENPALLAQTHPVLAYTQRLAWQLSPLLSANIDDSHIEHNVHFQADASPAAHRMQVLAELGQKLSEQRSLEKMIEVTMAFLSAERQIKRLALFQDGELIEGDASTQQQARWSGENWDDYALAIEFAEPLSNDDMVFYRSFQQQFATVRAQLQELGRHPQLLSELYEIASRREKLQFIRADKGYSGIYAADLMSPSYITLRLRAIRMYFDERQLLQVHRSYLVNPRKVQQAKKRGRDGWVLHIADETIPIARQYLPRLRLEYPHWFQEA